MMPSNSISSSGDLSLPKSLPGFEPSAPRRLPEFKVKKEEVPFFPVEEAEPPALPILDTFPEKPEKKGPVFVRTDDYSKVIDAVDNLHLYIKEAPEIILVLKNLKKNSDIEFKNYMKRMEDMQRKLVYIDNLLFEAMKE